jgi:hypothetical protein
MKIHKVWIYAGHPTRREYHNFSLVFHQPEDDFLCMSRNMPHHTKKISYDGRLLYSDLVSAANNTRDLKQVFLRATHYYISFSDSTNI